MLVSFEDIYSMELWQIDVQNVTVTYQWQIELAMLKAKTKFAFLPTNIWYVIWSMLP